MSKKIENTTVTFTDTVYVQRTIEIGEAKLEVKDSCVTVSDPAQITALDKMYGMKREGK